MSKPITLGFSGYALPAMAEAARRFEDEVLGLLPDHGAVVLFRGHRQAGQSETLPAEFHVLRFPSDTAFLAYLSDPRRSAILNAHGEVFTSKVIVRLDDLTP